MIGSRSDIFMRIVGIVGSPRPGGNTEAITRMALEEIEKDGIETEIIRLSEKKIEPCDACRSCRTIGSCRIKDDFETIYFKMVEADGIILATPVYYGAASPQMTNLLSRTYGYAYGTRRPFEGKVGGPIVVARRAGQNFTFAQLMFFYMIKGMIVPGSTYWNIAFGGEKGDVCEDAEGVLTVKNFGRKLAWLAKKLRS
jgi:multimeric flavodoxin WrbA